MKKIAMLVAGFVLLAGCKKEATPDPAGTNTISINWTSTYGQVPLELYKGPEEDLSVTPPYIWVKLGIVDASMNMEFWTLQSVDASFSSTYNTVGHGGEMVDMGRVDGLGDVVSKPSSGWSASSATQAGHGYVLRFKHSYNYNNNALPYYYYRLYVVQLDKNFYGGVIGATVKYQGPF